MPLKWIGIGTLGVRGRVQSASENATTVNLSGTAPIHKQMENVIHLSETTPRWGTLQTVGGLQGGTVLQR